MRSLQEEQSVNETIVETEAELLQQESNTRIPGFQESIHPQNGASYLLQDDIGQIQVRNKMLLTNPNHFTVSQHQLISGFALPLLSPPPLPIMLLISALSHKGVTLTLECII